MFCENCGNQLNEGAVFCPRCGVQTGAGSGVRVQGTNKSNVNLKKPKKTLLMILICIGVIFYIIWFGLICYMLSSDVGSSFIAVSILGAVCCLIILGELICAIANKKAVFVLSVMQAIVCVVDINWFLFVFSSLGGIFHVSGLWAVSIFYIEIPIVACVLLLLGGIMFRTKRIINELSGAAR